MNPEQFLYLATIIFGIGILGILTRKNLFVIYMSIELILSSINLVFATLSRVQGSNDGSVFAILMIGVIAAEAAIFLALIVYLFKSTKSINSEVFTKLSQLKGDKNG